MSHKIYFLLLLVFLSSCKKKENVWIEISDYKDNTTSETFQIFSDEIFIWNYTSDVGQPIRNESCFSTPTPRKMFDSIIDLLVKQQGFNRNCVYQVSDSVGNVKMIISILDVPNVRIDTSVRFADIRTIERLENIITPLTSPTIHKTKLERVPLGGSERLKGPNISLVKGPISTM